MRIDAISIGKNPPYDVNAIIEIPQGGEPVKYEIDKESGALFVDRFLYTAMRYPGGDHLILIGEVLAHEHSERAPLVYARGRYAQIAPGELAGGEGG